MSLVKETTFVTDIKGLCPLYWIKMDCGVFNVDVFICFRVSEEGCFILQASLVVLVTKVSRITSLIKDHADICAKLAKHF